ncbi:hypothetical protein AOL_s00076g409 [Orbilia oligospora ATCC 24927]|uniref:Xylanolytic transcriptional activator regulatory domain-containing protein n=1 Tax=Arthrobotrys oligospora (strain ATCC 24927 / CBS 115.81 / DSM 1491) TaxID=756982 RepID=G1X9S0_ARTOA|nr:hypothetical protein AOL_s00076g409 [Orbilia oligospora ATCC 24927]EGX50058.1 hypothetical protein AOL_s00076g409 [Orbilia oligospora ATCC 24927]
MLLKKRVDHRICPDLPGNEYISRGVIVEPVMLAGLVKQKQIRLLQTTIKDLNEKLKTADARLQSPTSTFSSKTTNRSSSSQSPRSPSPEQPRRFSFSSTGENFFLGSASTMSFVESLRGYMEGLGYDASLLDARGPSEETPHALSTSPYSDTLQIRDLRALLPTQSNGERFLMIFYQYLKRYMPAMCWCVIQQKFERAYRAPVFAEDRSSVTGIFCVLMTINAYASICSDDSDIFEVPNYSSKRGWYFLEFAKNFHDLNRPTHSLFDVEVLVIMAMYLESVALPYPLRLTVEYLAKVCKDIGLHRKSTYGKFKLRPVDIEHRSRIFWCTFLLDQKLALQFGARPIFDAEEIDIDEPGHNYTGDLTNEHANGGMSMEMPESIILTRSLTSISRLIGPIFRLVPQAHDAEHRLSHIEQQLDFFESNFPQGILAWESSTPLDPVLLDAAIFAMAIRLSLYRFFTDACLNPDFRARCLLQCLEVAKATVHLLRRTIKFPNWEENFRLRQCGLTYQHIFKTSTILLIAAAIFPKPVDTSSELRTCIGVLQIAAPTRPLVLQNLHTLDKLSEIMKQTPATALYRNLRAATLATIPPHISSKATVHLPEKSYFLTAPSLTATIPSNAPILASYKTGGSQVPLTLPSNDIPFRARVESPLGPNYKFPNIAAACPALENNIWLNQVDLPSWALMQTVLQQGDLR